ncbi:parallel beta-helix repeat protein [Bradyrhizobium sp. GM7.3]
MQRLVDHQHRITNASFVASGSKRLLKLAIPLILFGASPSSLVWANSEIPTQTLYVAPDGNDAWSGTSEHADGHGNGPLASPGRAIELLRKLKAEPGARQGGYRVLFRGGTFFLNEPIALRPEDSGTVDAPNLFAALPGENPIFSGGQQLTGWTVDQQGRWQLHLPEVQQGKWAFSQLYADGERRYPARLPKAGYFKTAAELPPSPAVAGRGFDAFGFAKDDISSDWYDFGSVEVRLLLNWSSAAFHIAELDKANGTVRLTGSTRQNWYKIPIGTRYRVEHVREALKDPGEFYADRKTGALTYIPAAGETPDNTIIVAPKLEHLLVLSDAGAENLGVRNLRFEGLTFAHTNWTLPGQGLALGQSAIGMPAAVTLVGARNVEFDRITVRSTGGHAMVLGPGCHFDRVQASQFTDLGAGAILIGDAVSTTTIPEFGKRRGDSSVSDISVQGNSITAIGRIDPAGVGIWIGNSPRNQIHRNEISDTYYSGISVGWAWGYGESRARDNVISGNWLHDIGQGVLSDLAGVYTLGVSPGTKITGNTISSVQGHYYGGFGIALDEGSSSILVENNLVYETSDGGFTINYGRENIVRNNVFALGRNAQLTIGTPKDDHLTVTFENNIVYWNGADSLFHGPWQNTNVIFDKNVYWNPLAGTRRLSDAMLFEEWKRLGRDLSSVSENPRFVSLSSIEASLDAGSPAVKLGFKPFVPRDFHSR